MAQDQSMIEQCYITRLAKYRNRFVAKLHLELVDGSSLSLSFANSSFASIFVQIFSEHLLGCRCRHGLFPFVCQPFRVNFGLRKQNETANPGLKL